MIHSDQPLAAWREAASGYLLSLPSSRRQTSSKKASQEAVKPPTHLSPEQTHGPLAALILDEADGYNMSVASDHLAVYTY